MVGCVTAGLKLCNWGFQRLHLIQTVGRLLINILGWCIGPRACGLAGSSQIDCMPADEGGIKAERSFACALPHPRTVDCDCFGDVHESTTYFTRSRE